MLLVVVSLIAVVTVLVVVVLKFWRQSTSCRSELQRYKPILDLNVAIDDAKVQLQQVQQQAQQVADADKHRHEQLEGQYKQAFIKYEDLQREVSLLEENLEDISFGLYKPHFTFQSRKAEQRRARTVGQSTVICGRERK